MDKWQRMMEIFPFILSSHQSHKINKTRLIEAVITAAIVAGVTYGAIKTEIIYLREGFQTLRIDVREDLRYMSSRVDRLYEAEKRNDKK